MESESLLAVFAIIFIVAAVFATISLQFRVPILIAYILVGVAIGPYGTSWITDASLLSEIAEVGIIFLLFLLGLDMRPEKMAKLFGQTAVVGIVSSIALFSVGALCGFAFGFSWTETWILGAAMMFSSTIVGIKLLPTTVLHHKHTGELMVSILLFQDLIAIALLTVLDQIKGVDDAPAVWVTLAALPTLVAGCYVFVRYVLLPLLTRFDAFHEYMFLLAIGWCLGVAELSGWLGLSPEIGAFIAGIALATSPISQYIAESLKPLRDFFLILFFFALGARFNLSLLPAVWLPSMALVAIIMLVKPALFSVLLRRSGERKKDSLEVGWRLAQTSEFSLLIAYLAFDSSLIGAKTSHIIQMVAIVSFILSTYIVIGRYASPLATDPALRRN